MCKVCVKNTGKVFVDKLFKCKWIESAVDYLYILKFNFQGVYQYNKWWVLTEQGACIVSIF